MSSKKIVLTLLIAAAICLAGLSVYFLISPDPAEKSRAGKSLLSLAAAVVAIVRVLHGNPAVSDKEYLTAYGDILNGAFADDKKSQNKLLRGIALYNQNRYANALRILTSLREDCVSEREHAAVLFFIAMCHDERGLYDVAADAYEEAVRRDPAFDVAWSNLGRLHTEKGKYEQAIRSLQTAVQINRANQYAHANLAAVFLLQLEYDKAIASAQAAIDIAPNMTEPLETLALCYAGKQDRQTAESYYQKSVLNGSDPEQLRSMLEGLYQGDASALSQNK